MANVTTPNFRKANQLCPGMKRSRQFLLNSRLPLDEKRYILFIVKLPDPAHPDVTPVRVQVPETVLLFTMPWRVSRLPLIVEPDCTVI